MWNDKVLSPTYVLYETLIFKRIGDFMIGKRLGGLVSASTRVVTSSRSKSPPGIWTYHIDAVVFLISGCSGAWTVVHDLTSQFFATIFFMFRGCINDRYTIIMDLYFALVWLIQYFNYSDIAKCDTQKIMLSCNSSSEDFTKF